MTNAELSAGVEERITLLFSPDQRVTVRELLRDECGKDLPFSQRWDKAGFDRVRFAALKVSDGDLAKLQGAVRLAKRDWRDLLVAP